MINKDEIPEPTYKELIELFGEKEAEKILNKYKYNFREITLQIYEERIVRKLKLQRSRNWIVSKTKMSLRTLLLILILIVFFLIVFLKF